MFCAVCIKHTLDINYYSLFPSIFVAESLPSGSSMSSVT